jgi:hypothetical protein
MAMSIQNTATAVGKLSHMVGQRDIDIQSAKALLNGAIEALLTNGPARERVSQARGCLEKLKGLRGQTSEESINDLRCIIDYLNKRISDGANDLSPEDEQGLTERLFLLYLDGSDGMLMW